MVAVIDNMATRNVQIILYNGHQHYFVNSAEYGANGKWYWWKAEYHHDLSAEIYKERDLMISLVEAYYKNGYDIAEMLLTDFINACVNEPPR